MFFRKKNKIEKAVDALEKEARRAVEAMVQEMCYELEAQRQIAVKTDLFTDKEITNMAEEYSLMASEHYECMDAEEILNERIQNMATRQKVIEVRL